MHRINATSDLLPELTRGTALTVTVNDMPVEAYEGETIAAVLLAADTWRFRRTRRRGEPRGLYCGMGMCFECLVTVDGVAAVRACLTPVTDGMRIETGQEAAP